MSVQFELTIIKCNIRFPRKLLSRWSKYDYSVLASFNESLLPLKHCFNSLLMTDSIVARSLLENKRLVSSAKLCMIDFENAHCRSLMHGRNNKGPKVDPWGITQVIVLMIKETPWRETYSSRFFRKRLNQFLK